MPAKPPIPPDPDLSAILSRIESRLDGLDARLERIEAEQTRQGDVVEQVRSTMKLIFKANPALARIAEDRDWAQEEKERVLRMKAADRGFILGKNNVQTNEEKG